MKLKPVAALIFCSAALLSACNTNPNQDINSMSGYVMGQRSEANILEDVIVLNKNEMAAAQLAKHKAFHPAVKKYASFLYTQHRNNLNKTMHLAHKLHIHPAMNPMAAGLKQKGQHELAQLSGLQGAAFDRAYMHAMIMDHREALQLLDRMLMNQANHKVLVAHLQATRHHVMMHLQKAEQIASHLGR